jgi:hypothetical protein
MQASTILSPVKKKGNVSRSSTKNNKKKYQEEALPTNPKGGLIYISNNKH